MKKSKIKIPLRKNYLAIIENSKGTKIFQDCFGRNGKIKNLTEWFNSQNSSLGKRGSKRSKKIWLV